ncbi:unnamed protein product [Sphagnum jensenii]|uniref:Rapamycin-insensitive companion of mTOR domain-containing protein n=1 Tax=Sphagnum jensenii TaxID=128206 RepID=A0ABP1A1L2_9BRYO
MNDAKGLLFIESDRRATLFHDIAKEVEQLVICNGSGWNSNSAINPTQLVFRFKSCNHSMCREYFTFLGRIGCSDQGKVLIDNSALFEHITSLGGKRPLDYLSRVAITATSKELRVYIYTILLALLRAHPVDSSRYIIDILLYQLAQEEGQNMNPYLLNILEEAAQDPKILTLIIAQKPALFTPEMIKLRIRSLSQEEGIDYLQSKNIVSTLINNWTTKESMKYALNMESALARALNKTYIQRKAHNIDKIVISVTDVVGPKSVIRDERTLASSSMLGPEAVDVEGLLRIPFNIEVKLTTAATNPTSPASQATSEYLRVDSFLGHSDGARKKSMSIVQNQVQAIRPNASSPTSDAYLDDLPVTLNNEHLYDWSVCKPQHRQSNFVILPDNKFAVSVPDQPVTWVFSRTQSPGDSYVESSHDTKGTAVVYLVEVQYYLTIETGLPIYVPITRHAFGELARTQKGCNLLHEFKILDTQLSIARNESADEDSRRAALWTLGHICASDYGCAAICEYDSRFIDWLVSFATNSKNFALRGTAFYTLGLLSRSKRGFSKLLQLNWLSSSFDSFAAIAIPQNLSVMFQFQGSVETDTSTPASAAGTVKLELTTAELEVYNLIIKVSCYSAI